MTHFLIRVEASNFVAGLIMDQYRRVIHAAPILHWTLGCRDFDLRPLFKTNGWRVTVHPFTAT